MDALLNLQHLARNELNVYAFVCGLNTVDAGIYQCDSSTFNHSLTAADWPICCLRLDNVGNKTGPMRGPRPQPLLFFGFRLVHLNHLTFISFCYNMGEIVNGRT